MSSLPRAHNHPQEIGKQKPQYVQRVFVMEGFPVACGLPRAETLCPGSPQ